LSGVDKICPSLKGTKQKISPVTLRNKAREADPKIYVFTSGDEIGLVKIVDEAQEKIEKSLAQGIPKSIGKSESDFEKISNHLIRLAKPEIEKILGIYIELKEQSDKIAKEESLPLLQKDITNPI